MLTIENIRVNIKEFVILRNVSLQVSPGQIVGLVGRNGAGKTTTLRSIMGLIPARAGTARLNNQDLLKLPAHARASLGIGYVPEDRRLISDLTVEENILLPAWAVGWRDYPQRLAFIYELIPDLAAMAARPAPQLSGGQQKLLALARALMNGRHVLLLDEPFEGVAPSLAHKLGQVISTLKTNGLAVLLAESDPKLVSSMADHIYTIERGEII